MSDPSPETSGKGPRLFLAAIVVAAASALFLREPRTCGGDGKFIPLCKASGSDGKISEFDFIRRRLSD